MAIDLYMVRIVLNSLGAVDYGIFDVVAGVVLMFQSVLSVLVVSTQRFYSFELGKKSDKNLQGIFSSSMNVYLLLSAVIIIICETAGVWFVNTHLTIPLERLPIAIWVFQFSVFSFIFTILQIPYSAAVIANEDMGIFSIICILNCFLKFIFALLISSVPFDRLGYYGGYLLLVSFLCFLSYVVIGHNKYSWCHYNFKTAHQHLEILKFSGWTFWGSLANVGMTQVCTILVNVFFGPVVNAARAISFQVNNAISAFCGSFLMAIRPPMIKAYAEGDYLYLNKLFDSSNKIVYYSLLLVCLPLFLEMDTILFYWLKTTDNQTILFARLIIVYALLLSLNNPITFIIHATGRVKEYHTLVEIPTLLCAPITYFLFKLGLPAYSTYISMIGAIFISHLIRIVCLKRFYSYFAVRVYIMSFCMPAIIVTVVHFFTLHCIHVLLIESVITRLISVCLLNVCLLCSTVWLFVLKQSEKEVIKSCILSVKSKFVK